LVISVAPARARERDGSGSNAPPNALAMSPPLALLQEDHQQQA
jgi:hypothetical protein